MPYSSYNAYIFQRNCSVILGLLFINKIAIALQFKPLLFILNWFYFRLAEYLLLCICLYNIYCAIKHVINPCLLDIVCFCNSIGLFTPGPIVTLLWNIHCFFFRDLLLKTEEQNKFMSITPLKNSFNANVLATDSMGKPTYNTLSTSTCSTAPPFANIGTAPSGNTAAAPSGNSAAAPSGNSAAAPSNDNVFKPQVISPIESLNIMLMKSYSSTSTPPQTSKPVPKLVYTPCIQPSLQPKEYRERILWYLNPTPDVVDDFRIEQIIGFKKNWYRFNDSYSRTYYDNLTAALVNYIFTPLATSIEIINKKLPRCQTVATCTPTAVAVSFMVPNFNKNSPFSLSEVIQMLTLENHASPEAIQYVCERVKELAANKKMFAYSFIPKRSGMPTDSVIIMHIFKKYLLLKKPRVIPPLVPEELDLFKFLLIYVYMTPELDDWKIFN